MQAKERLLDVKVLRGIAGLILLFSGGHGHVSFSGFRKKNTEKVIQLQDKIL